MAVLRNKKRVLFGAPDVKATGGFQITKVIDDVAKFPKDASSKLAVDFDAQPGGYVDKDGVSKTVDRSTEKIKDWNLDTVMIVQTDHSVVLKVTAMESANAAVLKTVYGPENVIVSADGKKITTIDAADDLPHQGLDFNMVGGNNSKIRVFAPDTQVTSVGDIKFVRDDVIKYELELECFDVAGDGKKLWSFMDLDGAAAAPGPGAAA